MQMTDIIGQWIIPSIAIVVTVALWISNRAIKKQTQEMLEQQKNLERYFKPLSFTYGFGESPTQIPDKDLNYYTLKPFQLTVLQGDIKAYSFYLYSINPMDNTSQLRGNQPIISSFEKIKYDQNTKENYGRVIDCIPEKIDSEIYKFDALDSEGNIHKVEMFNYYIVLEDYTGQYETLLVLYIKDIKEDVMTGKVVDKFSSFINLPVEFHIGNINPTKEYVESYYGNMNRLLANYQDLRRRVKDNF